MSADALRKAGRAAISLTLALPFCIAVARAQGTLPKSPPLPPTPERSEPAPDRPTAKPYDLQLDRLAEILGTLAFMRDLCGNNDGGLWRDKMAALVEAEGRSTARTSRLAGSYNRGYRGYQMTYRQCTPAAQAVIARSLEEGGHLARDLSLRFGSD